jgi:LysR family cyn operon transcriptional activator
MELHQLRYLRAVVRTGSVTAAAEAELVAQPSVSKQMRSLERELGVPLFHRVGRRVVPTEAALALADCADRVFDDIGATVGAISGPDSARGGTLRMCATETVSDHLLPPALTWLRKVYPSARIRVEMLGTDDAIARVLADEVDLAIVVLPLADSRLDVQHLLTEDVLIAVPTSHRWAREKRVSLDGALREPGLLLSMPGHGLRAMVDEAAQARGITLDGSIELRSQQALLAMVAAGGGIAFSPRMAVRGREDIVALPLDPPLRREIGWIRRKGRHLPAVAVELLRGLAEGAS